MSTQDKNEQLDDYLADNSTISKLYQQAKTEELTPATDTAILAAARRGVSAKPEAVSSTRYRWLIPASLAAGLAIIISVVLISQRYEQEISDNIISSSPVAGPEKWLQKIEFLAKENKQSEALSELKAFKQAFPDYEIDDKKYVETKKMERLLQQ